MNLPQFFSQVGSLSLTVAWSISAADRRAERSIARQAEIRDLARRALEVHNMGKGAQLRLRAASSTVQTFDVELRDALMPARAAMSRLTSDIHGSTLLSDETKTTAALHASCVAGFLDPLSLEVTTPHLRRYLTLQDVYGRGRQIQIEATVTRSHLDSLISQELLFPQETDLAQVSIDLSKPLEALVADDHFACLKILIEDGPGYARRFSDPIRKLMDALDGGGRGARTDPTVSRQIQEEGVC